MNRAFSYVITVIVSVVFTLIGDRTERAPKVPASSAAALSTNAAFRDGSYQARLDIGNGRKPHLSAGRWSTDEDRALYIAGYQLAYVHALSTGVKKPAAAEPSEVDGYRDGISDGAHDQKASGRFQLDKTERYRTAGARLDANDLARLTHAELYRQGYSNGYQEGFYAEQKRLVLRTVTALSNP